MSHIQRRVTPRICLWVFSLSLLALSIYAAPSTTPIDAISKELKKGNLREAGQQLRSLRNKNFGGLNIEGKTCRNQPAFILMVAAENKIRIKDKEAATNYLQQLRCLATVGNKALSKAERLTHLRQYQNFTPQAIHECPKGLGNTQLQKAQQWKTSGKQEKALHEALKASCLLGAGHSKIATLLLSLAQIQPKAPATDQAAIQTPSTSQKQAQQEPQKRTEPPVTSHQSTSETNIWLPIAIGSVAALALIAWLLLRKAAVFISYRRRDSAGWAQTIHDKLADKQGHEDIFMDLHDIPAGIDFAHHLEQTLKDVQTVIVIIGPDWEAGTRIHDDNDWVRQEIVHAMNSGKKVIPVLVDHRQMPSAENLPEDLRPMSRLNAITLYPDQLDAGIKRLLKAIR